MVEAVRAHWYECANCSIRTVDESKEERSRSYWDLHGADAFRKLSSDITGWEMLRKLKRLGESKESDEETDEEDDGDASAVAD